MYSVILTLNFEYYNYEPITSDVDVSLTESVIDIESFNKHNFFISNKHLEAKYPTKFHFFEIQYSMSDFLYSFSCLVSFGDMYHVIHNILIQPRVDEILSLKLKKKERKDLRRV